MRYFVGIDVAKREHQMVVLDEQGQRVGTAQAIANSRAGFEQGVKSLRALEGTVTIALEATGQYWWALYEHLV
jgi:transposase